MNTQPPHSMRARAHSVLRQGGAVLVISLMILLILTLIGINAMTTATLEERMAGNLRDYNLALEAAETAVRDGERWLVQRASARGTDFGFPVFPALPNRANDEVWHFDGFATSAGCAGPNSTDVTQQNPATCWTPQAWMLANTPALPPGPGSPTYNAPPLYAIEFVSIARDDTSAELPPNQNGRYMYRVTARGVGGTANAEAYVQSVYAVRF